MLERGSIINEVSTKLSILKVAIDQATANGLTDLNKHCEFFVMQILNRTFDYDMVNLNKDADNFLV